MSGLDEEARGLVRLGCWEWLPGMPWRGRYAEDGGEARGRVLSTLDMDMVTGRDGWVLKPANVDDCRPRLEDPATEGLLLQLYRKASGHSAAWVEPMAQSGGWRVSIRAGYRVEWCSDECSTAVLALCDALGRL